LGRQAVIGGTPRSGSEESRVLKNFPATGVFWTGTSGKSGKSEIRMPCQYRFDLKIVANAPDKEGERKKGKKRKRKF
jgi:hypothetical protein